jgi:hypothetical protein
MARLIALRVLRLLSHQKLPPAKPVLTMIAPWGMLQICMARSIASRVPMLLWLHLGVSALINKALQCVLEQRLT